MEFKTILAAIDGGEDTHKVLDLAVSLPHGAANAIIHLLCVVDILPATTSAMAATTDLTIDAIKSLAVQTGQDAVKWLQDKNIRAELHIATGNSVETIVSNAKRLNCDAIVLGHRHRTFWMRFLEQSTCEALLDAATCPLMIAK